MKKFFHVLQSTDGKRGRDMLFRLIALIHFAFPEKKICFDAKLLKVTIVTWKSKIQKLANYRCMDISIRLPINNEISSE